MKIELSHMPEQVTVENPNGQIHALSRCMFTRAADLIFPMLGIAANTP
jgi:hypothetical protein